MNNYLDRKKDIENTIIFVEGISDLAFLSLLLKRWNNYEYVEDLKVLKPRKGMKCTLYNAKSNNIIIFSVGGVENFNYAYNLLKPQINSSSTKNVVMIIDNDLNDEEKILNNLNLNMNLQANKWFVSKIIDDYEEEKELNMYIKIIPEGKIGALETVLIDAVRKTEEDITLSAVNYIDNLNDIESKYISKKRLNLKAKTGVIFNLLSPDKTFDALQKKFELINIDDESIIDNFGFLKKVI